MMKKFAFAAFAAVPALVFTSCSSPEESATDSVKDVLVDLTELIKDNKSACIVDLVDELHAFVEDVTPDLMSDFEDLTDAERAAVIVNVLKSDEGKKLVAELESLSTNESLLKVVNKAMNGKVDSAADLPMETKLQAVDICANLVKIAVTLGIDKPSVQEGIEKGME